MANSEPGYVLRTTLMLKVLSILTPGSRWTSDWLHSNVRQASGQPFPFGPYWLIYAGQPGGSGKEHNWRIFSPMIDAARRLESVVKAIEARSQMPVPVIKPSPGEDPQQRLNYRSPAEVEIGRVLEQKRVLFFPNARCRIVNRNQIALTKEVDFLVFFQGQARMLEVDGREYHQDADLDHQRDRLFEWHGLRSTRFTAQECLQDPVAVVEEFLELFRP